MLGGSPIRRMNRSKLPWSLVVMRLAAAGACAREVTLGIGASRSLGEMRERHAYVMFLEKLPLAWVPVMDVGRHARGVH